MTDVVLGADGLARCAWAAEPADYRTYHDDEWGQPVHGDDRLFERLTLEAFQSGLSWLTILRKRPAFRAAFADFSIEAVASFDDDDVERLLADAGIVRNRAKVLATMSNANAAMRLIRQDGPGALDRLVWAHAPSVARPRPRTAGDVPTLTAGSQALARALKATGFVFVGPTTAYAAMQACGLVDDHLAGCHRAAEAPTGAGPRLG